MDRFRIGIDLGGSKIELVALDAAGSEVLRRRVATPQGDYPATLECIAGLVTAAEQELGAGASVGIGTPGAISRATGLLKNSNSVCLNGNPLLEDLQSLLQRPLRMANDADCFALSEASDGAAAGADSVFGVIIGTGTGGGVVCHGRLLSGINAIAGEWGHNPLPWPGDDERPGPACYCGRQGCIETWLSGPGLERDYRQATGQQLPAADIAALDTAGDSTAGKTLQRYIDRLARSLAGIINIIDPEVIVLGGGLGNIQRLYRDVPAAWGQYVFSDRVDTRLVAPKYGDSSGVRGAAWLWPLDRQSGGDTAQGR
ncbi:MAG TPA: ROK family protein [Gammaproteobacteria bacterium]|nr:ROK family protein [Gammaproteobacteria bacterium]